MWAIFFRKKKNKIYETHKLKKGILRTKFLKGMWIVITYKK